MPGCQPEAFGSPNDTVSNQLTVTDIDVTTFGPFPFTTVLVDGTLVVEKVNMFARVIGEKWRICLVSFPTFFNSLAIDTHRLFLTQGTRFPSFL
jgi:hypothetical protein